MRGTSGEVSLDGQGKAAPILVYCQLLLLDLPVL